MATPTIPTPPSLDLGRCLRFVTDDPAWVPKLLVGGLFTLLSPLVVGMFFVAGYWVRFVRRVVAGDNAPLPEWDDLGGLFHDGLKLVGAYFVFLLGMLGVVLALGCVVGLVGVGIGGLSNVSEGAGGVAALLGGLGMFAAYAIFAVLALVAGVFLPAVFVRVALMDRFDEAFALRPTLAFIQGNLGNYLLSLVFYLLANFASQFGALLCCVGIFPAMFWSYLVLGYALGETVRLNPRSI